MRRILLLITDLEIGGTPTVVRELAIRLNDPANGVIVEVACLAKWGPVADRLREAGILVTAFEARGTRDLLPTVNKLGKLIRQQRIDTVFSFLIHANTVAAIAAMSLPEVRWLQSIQTTQAWPKWHWWVQKWIADFAEIIVVPSNAVAKVARIRSGVSAESLLVIPNAMDAREFQRVATFSGTPSRVGFLGRLDPVKNVPALVDAIKLLADRPIECHIFGDGPAKAEIERAIERTNQTGRIHLHGTVSRPQIALAQMDILVLPSRGEGFGLVLIEAMASGVPVIAAAVGEADAARDIIDDGVNGLLVTGERMDNQIAAAITRLIDDASLRNSLIDQAMLTVQKKYTWETVLPTYRELLKL